MLAESIKGMTKEHKNDEVIIYSRGTDEFYPIVGMETSGSPGFVKNDGSEILGNGHIFLVIPEDGIKHD